MATQTEKVYRIRIQTDAAQQEVEATKKKLAELDEQLSGLDSQGDAAKAIVAEMAKLAGALDGAEGKVADLNEALDNLKPGTVPALEAEIEELEKAFRRATEGTEEYNQAFLKLGNANGQLKAIEDGLDALDPKNKAAAFADFANGVVGAVAIAATSAQVFGLSKEAADEYQNKLLSLITIMDGVENVSRALNSETLSVVKSTYAGAKAWLGFGEAAAAGSKVTRAALISTGIGVIVLLVALLAANFDKVKEAGSAIYAKFKPAFDGVAAVIDVVLAKGRDLASFMTFGFVDDAAKHAQAVAVDLRQKELAKQAEHTARLIEILKSRGTDTLAMEVANAKRRLDSLKNSTEEEKKAYLDATKEYIVLRTQLQKRAADEEKAARLTHLNGLIAAQQARGADAFKAELAAKREQLAQLNQAEAEGQHVAAAQREQLENEIAAAELGRATQQAAKRRALQDAYLVASLARLQASTADQSNVEVAANAKQIAIAQQHRANLLAQAQVDKAAVVAADAELYTLRQARARLYYKEAAEIEASQLDVRVRAFAAMRKKDADNEQFYQDTLNRMQAAGARITQETTDKLAAGILQKQIETAAKADIYGNLLQRIFGINDAQAEALKTQLAAVGQAVGSLTSALFAGATQEADAQLTQAQARLQEISAQLTEATNQRASDEAALATANGSRRDYLLTKINKEKAAEQALAQQKAKAAKEEQAAAKKKAEQDKIQQEITAATTVVESVLLGIKAAQAVVKASSEGKVGYDNIALAIAAAVAIGASIVAMKNAAKSYGGGGELGDGGEIVGGSHASGNDVAVMGGRYRVEGKEMITNVRSTQNNRDWLHLINSRGKSRRLTLADFAEAGNVRVLPHPTGRSFGAGGELGGGGSVPAGSVVVPAADLAELVANTRIMVSHLQNVDATNQQIAGYGPANLQIGPGEAKAIRAEEQKADQSEEWARE